MKPKKVVRPKTAHSDPSHAARKALHGPKLALPNRMPAGAFQARRRPVIHPDEG